MCSLGTMANTGLRLVLVGLFLVLGCRHGSLSQLLGLSTLPPQIFDDDGDADDFVKCQVQDFEKVPCGESDITATQCDAINCCFDGQLCYYGKMVTAQCTIDGQFVLVVARDATLPRLALDSISLLGGNTGPCSPVDSNTAFAIYQFPVTACGTTMMVNAGYVIYENRMLSAYEVGVGPYGVITRDPQFELYFQCRYSGVGFATLIVDPLPGSPALPVVASGPLQVELRIAKGHCLSTGCAEEEAAAYTSYYNVTDYPVTKILREPVCVEVRIVGRTDPNIVLVLGGCWATTSPNPYSLPKWDLLINGCPYSQDRYLTRLIPVTNASGLAYPTHYRRFVLKMFTFVDPASMAPLLETIYIHCSTAVCVPTAQDSCQPKCNRRRRDISTAGGSFPDTAGIVSSGKVIFIQV